MQGAGKGRLVLKGHGAIGVKRARQDEGAAASRPALAAPPVRAAALAGGEDAAPASPAAEPEPALERHACRGLLYTSGTTVTGLGTAFKAEVRPGDVLELAGDARPVSFVLSDTSLSLREGFLVDAAPPGVSFVVARRVRGGGGGGSGGEGGAAAAAAAALRRVEGSAEAATGVSSSSMRVNKAGVKGAYVSVAVAGGAQLSREELLDLRCKAKGEKVL